MRFRDEDVPSPAQMEKAIAKLIRVLESEKLPLVQKRLEQAQRSHDRIERQIQALRDSIGVYRQEYESGDQPDNPAEGESL